MMAITEERKTDKPYRKITDILVRRDRITEEEAVAQVVECRKEIFAVLRDGGGYEDAVDVIEGYLGLEPDYMDYMRIYC